MSYNRFNGIIPWKAIGENVHDCKTSAQAIQRAGLDFTVEKRPLFTFDFENHHGDPETELLIPELEVPNFFATVRTDTDEPLGIVQKRYHCEQNIEVFNFLDSLAGSGQLVYDSAGCINRGKDVFISVKLPEQLRIGKDDMIDQYLFIGTSHDGKKSITIAYTPIRLFCTNMLGASNSVRIIHTKNANQRLIQAREALNITKKISEETEAVFNHWSKVRITDQEVKKLIQMAMAPDKETLKHVLNGDSDHFSTHFVNTCGSVFSYAMESDSQLVEATAGTVYGAFNAITGFYQNVNNYKNEEAKVKSMLYGGTAQRRTQIAFDLCDSFTRHGADSFQMN